MERKIILNSTGLAIFVVIAFAIAYALIWSSIKLSVLKNSLKEMKRKKK